MQHPIFNGPFFLTAEGDPSPISFHLLIYREAQRASVVITQVGQERSAGRIISSEDIARRLVPILRTMLNLHGKEDINYYEYRFAALHENPGYEYADEKGGLFHLSYDGEDFHGKEWECEPQTLEGYTGVKFEPISLDLFPIIERPLEK